MTEPDGLIADRLAVDRGGRAVLRDVSFRLAPGAAMVVTGSNGAGKSTLLRAIAGLIPRRTGSIGLRLADGLIEVAEHTHYVGHANGLKLSLTVLENLDFFLAWGGGRGATPAAALDSVGLGHLADIPANVLSAGQRRRVALARLLVAPRPLWLLDEPATGLDAPSEAWLERLMRDHLATGGLLMAAIHAPLLVGARELRLGAS